MTFTELEEKAKSAQTLEELFDLWRKAHTVEENYEETTVPETKKRDKVFPAIERDSFIADGYVSQPDYEASAIKVLFVLREANIATHRENDIPSKRTHEWFYGSFIKEMADNPPKQKQKMARMAYYLQHPGLPDDMKKKPDDEALKTALKCSGYMNINKRGGGATVNKAVFYNYHTKYATFIIRQIEIMSPDIIIEIGYNGIEGLSEHALPVWHTSYRMKGKQRSNNPQFSSDKNVDCYMKEFFERVENRDDYQSLWNMLREKRAM